MKSFKLIFLTLLGSLIFGSAGYFGYQLFVKPGRAVQREKAAKLAAPLSTPTPDPGQGDFDRLKSLQSSGKVAEARGGWRAWIETHPKSNLMGEARRQLGNANLALLFQPGEGTTAITYTVAKGDSLAKIAAKNHSSAELIQRANSLPGINLQIGQQLVIPSLKVSVTLDRSARTLTLLDNALFLKEYTLVSAPSAPKAPGKPEGTTTKVLDKIATSGTKRVAFGDKAYAASERVILIAQAPPITALPIPATAGPVQGASNTPAAAPPMPGGYVLAPEDLMEIFPLVSRNTRGDPLSGNRPFIALLRP